MGSPSGQSATRSVEIRPVWQSLRSWQKEVAFRSKSISKSGHSGAEAGGSGLGKPWDRQAGLVSTAGQEERRATARASQSLDESPGLGPERGWNKAPVCLDLKTPQGMCY